MNSKVIVLKKEKSQLVSVSSDRLTGKSEFDVLFPIGDGNYLPVLLHRKPFASYAEADIAMYQTGLEICDDKRLRAIIVTEVATGISGWVT